MSSYQYDGNGLRVSRVTGGQTTIYVYDAWGNAAAEYTTGTVTSPCGTPTCYLTQDHLGSTRMLTDNVGSSSVVRYDYQPFGQEILAGYDGRLTSMGYLGAPDDTNPKFTGQDRDVETGLDWFQVRYMSGAAGRFQSSDPGNAGADTSDPQMWNGFAYVGNNPLSFTDPSGQSWWSDLLGIGLEIAGFFLTGDPVLGTEIQAIGIGLEAAGSAVTLGGRIADSIGGGNSEGPAGLPGTQDPFGFPRGNGFTDCNANV
ncbi:MAG: RHS repeat-associated core domain-containing protein, partial [Bryobacteraceae bacterium]